jgi:hypothetical protein
MASTLLRIGAFNADCKERLSASLNGDRDNPVASMSRRTCAANGCHSTFVMIGSLFSAALRLVRTEDNKVNQAAHEICGLN